MVIHITWWMLPLLIFIIGLVHTCKQIRTHQRENILIVPVIMAAYGIALIFFLVGHFIG